MSGIRYTQEQYEQLIRDMRAPKMQDNSAGSAPNVEPHIKHESSAENVDKEVHQRFCIRVHSKRRRLTDSDGLCAKFAIDGLVKGGLLKDDSAKYVQSVSFSQELSEIEETVIEVWELLK